MVKELKARVNWTQVVFAAIITTAVGTAAAAMVSHENSQDRKIEDLEKFKTDVAVIKSNTDDIKRDLRDHMKIHLRQN